MSLEDLLMSVPGLSGDIVTTDGLLGPGESVTSKIEAGHRHNVLSFAAMLLPTNDTFVAVDSVRLPYRYVMTMAKAYDAGTEINDESCANIPGPYCGGNPVSEEVARGLRTSPAASMESGTWRRRCSTGVTRLRA